MPDGSLHELDISFASDKSGAWKTTGGGGAGHFILHWCVYCAHRSDCKFANSAFLCIDCWEDVQNQYQHIPDCKHEELISSSMHKYYIELGKDTFFSDLSMNPPTTVLIDDLRSFLFVKLKKSEATLMRLLGITRRLHVNELKAQIDMWYSSYFVLPHEIETAPMEKVIAMLAAMNIDLGGPNYIRARDLAMSAKEWVRRPNPINHIPHSDGEKRDVLRYLFYLGNRITYCQEREVDPDRIIRKIELLDPCTMHGLHRIILVFCNALAIEGGEESKMEIQLNVNAIFMNVEVDSDELATSPYQFLIDLESGLKTSCARSEKIFERIEELLAIVNRVLGWGPNHPRMVLWENAISSFRVVLNYLKVKVPFSDDEIKHFQRAADIFGQNFVALHGEVKITNYINDLIIGNFRYFLKKRRNLYLVNQCGIEAKIGSTASFIERRTQHYGHGGALGCKYSVAQAMEGKIVRDITRTCDTYRGNLDLEDYFLNTSREAFNEQKRAERNSIRTALSTETTEESNEQEGQSLPQVPVEDDELEDLDDDFTPEDEFVHSDFENQFIPRIQQLNLVDFNDID
jgi:hypothetical protein